MADLETERLILRRFNTTDFKPFAIMNADAEVMKYSPGTLEQRESDQLIERILARKNTKGDGFWAVVEKISGNFSGFIGLNDVIFEAPFAPNAEIGWHLARPFWGKGYASESARALLKYGFETLGFAEIVSFAPKANQRSFAVMERIGMVRDTIGDFLHPLMPHDHPLAHHILYRISKTISD